MITTTEEELKFLESYEGKAKEFHLLTILKDGLTEKGMESYNKIKKYLLENFDSYMTIKGR